MSLSSTPSHSSLPEPLANDEVPTEEGVNVDQRDIEGEQLIRDLPPLPEPDGKPHRPTPTSS